MSKDLEYYQNIHYKMVWEYNKNDKVYFVRFPELPGCLAHGNTEKKALEAALRVKNEWLETAYAAGWEIPENSTTPETTGRITTRLPKFLHQSVIDRAETERVSLNQLILTFIAQGLERISAEESLNKIMVKQENILSLISESVEILRNEQDFIASWNQSRCQYRQQLDPFSASWISTDLVIGSSFVTEPQNLIHATTATPTFVTEFDKDTINKLMAA